MLLGAALLLGGGIQTQAKKYMNFGVAFYNLENLFDTINNNGKYDIEFSPEGKNKWDTHKFNSKLKNMSYTISQMKTKTTPDGPAMIGVCEIENRSVLEALVKQPSIADMNLQVIHHDSPDRRGVDVGLLYNPKFFKPIRVTNHTLTELDFPTRDQMCVVGLLGGKRVGVIVNHWPSRRGGDASSPSREAAARLCVHIADSLMKVDPNMGVIIMGDLNDDPTNKSCAEVLDAKRNKKDVLGKATGASVGRPEGARFYNPFWAKLDRGEGSYIYREHWDLFDQIIVNRNLLDGAAGLEFENAIVFNKDFLKQQDGKYKGYPFRTFSGGVWTNGFSDHFPTEIFLRLEVK